MITTSFDEQWATPISRAKARSLSNKERFKQKTYEKNPATAGLKIYNELSFKIERDEAQGDVAYKHT